MKPLILLIEDEPAIADAVRYALENGGYRVTRAQTGEAGLSLLSQERPALVVLDVGLPDMSGFDLFRMIREQGAVPVIFLTARDSEIDRVSGLEMGADDYVTKPFSPRELAARVGVVLRRITAATEAADAAPLNSVPFQLDEGRFQILYFGRPLALSRYEYGILKTLVRHPGRVFSREQLMEQAWDVPDISDPRTVDTHIKTIRRKLADIRSDLDAIVTHRGFGYALRETW